MLDLMTLAKWLLIVAAVLGIAAAARGAAHALRPDPASESPQAPVDPRQSGQLIDLLEPIRARYRLPSLAAAIITGGEVHEIAATGVRRAGHKEHISIDDKFHIGSCTKAMTATMLATLVEEGTLAWNTTIAEIFHDVPMDDAWREITLAQLLHNRAGAPAGLNEDGLWARLWAFDGTPREARMELVRGILKHAPKNPGEYLYSNAGYAIAGAMAERIADKPWEDLMTERLFQPLGMTSAGFGAPGNAETLDQPRGHHASGKIEEPGPRADNPPAIGPAGTIHCTLHDWARFIALHTRGARNEPAFLSSETFAALHTPGPQPRQDNPPAASGTPYAMGWIITARPWAQGGDGNGRVLTHAGSNTLWYAVAWLAPERDLAILIATNQGGASAMQACDEAAGALIRHHLENAQEISPAGP